MKKISLILFFNFIIAIGGGNPWAVFNVAPDANSLSLSRANSSVGTPGFYQFSNPALLYKTNKLDVGMTYNAMQLDRSNQVISLNVALPPQAGVGLSISRSGTSNIIGRDSDNNNIGKFDNHEILGMISFGLSFNQYISLGMNIKASYSNLDDLAEYSLISNSGIGLDSGFLINYNRMSFALKIENISSSKNWTLTNIVGEGNSYVEEIPTIYSIGSHYKFTKQFTMYFTSMKNFSNLIPSANRFAFSYDIKDNFGFRGGISSGDSISKKIGFYYNTYIWENKMVQLGYGLDFGRVDEGLSHIFTWTFIN